MTGGPFSKGGRLVETAGRNPEPDMAPLNAEAETIIPQCFASMLGTTGDMCTWTF